MSDKQTEGSEANLLYGSIIDWLSGIKKTEQFAPMEKIEEFGPEWDYVGTMSSDAKALWTILAQIRELGKKICKELGTGKDDAELMRQNSLLIERHKIIRALMDNVIQSQVTRDLNAAGMDPSSIEIAFSGDYELFVRQMGDAGCCGCPACQMEKTNMPVIAVDMTIASPSELSSVELEMIALSLFGGLRTKKRSGSDHEECDHDLADDPTGQDKEN